MSLERRNIKHGTNEHVTEVRADTRDARVLGTGHTSQHPVETERFEFQGAQLHERTFARKINASEGLAKHAYEHYRQCREAGLPVPVTFGIDEVDKLVTIASDLTCDGKYVVESHNIRNLELQQSTIRIDRILAPSAIARQIADISAQAAYHGIKLPVDSVLYRFLRSGGDVTIEFVIADFDRVRTFNNPVRTEVEAEQNREFLVDSFMTWIRKWPDTRMKNVKSAASAIELVLRNRTDAYLVEALESLRARDSETPLTFAHFDRVIRSVSE